MFNVNILTLFPDMFPSFLGKSLSGKALEKDIWSLNVKDIRDYTEDVHKKVDDTPCGGGAGMVLKPDILDKAISGIKNKGRLIYMSPRGKLLNQTLVKEISIEENITILCGRYEGIDQRIIDSYDIEEISVGDYILSGGEPAALTLLDSCIRLLDGVMGNNETTEEESFENGLLEYPLYTKPISWVDKNEKSWEVPEILSSGHHKNIKNWRLEQSEKITKIRRPDLWKKYKKN